ncbi:unnamed protein product, partial [Pocillopora meandrina]
MLADDNINIAEYLLSSRENNYDKFNEEIENLKQLSWPMVTSHLMIIGELNVSDTTNTSCEDGYYTKTCNLISDWMFENGGL